MIVSSAGLSHLNNQVSSIIFPRKRLTDFYCIGIRISEEYRWSPRLASGVVDVVLVQHSSQRSNILYANATTPNDDHRSYALRWYEKEVSHVYIYEVQEVCRRTK